MKGNKSVRLWGIAMAVALILALAATFALTGPLYTVMNMYFGKGEAVLTADPAAANLDANYYVNDYPDATELLRASQELAVEIEGEGIVLLKNDNGALPLADSEKNISMFGRTSVDPVYTGAGSAATEATPVSYKEAFEDAGYALNPALYDFYANHAVSTQVIKTTMQTGMGPQDVSYTGRGLKMRDSPSVFDNRATDADLLFHFAALTLARRFRVI